MVSVTPEVSSSAVLIVGSGHGPMVGKGSTMPAGDAVAPATTLGQTALKSGHSSWLSRLPSIGTACTRAQYSAPKKAAKNITSREDEPAHAPAERDVDAVGVQAALALADGVAGTTGTAPTARPPGRAAASRRPSRRR